MGSNNNKNMAEGLKLIQLAVSPWTERCKFALKVAGMLDGLEIINYTPMVDVLYLRCVLGVWNPSAVVSVPVLVLTDGTAIPDSTAIAKWAASRSNGKLVIPPEDELNKILTIADRVMNAGRFRVSTRCGAEGVIDDQDIPPPLRILPDFVKSFTSKFIYSYLNSKYAKDGWTVESCLQDMKTGLTELDEMRKANGGKFMVGTSFSLADIVAASALANLAPLPNGFSRTGPKLSEYWFERDLAEEFKEFVEWRDQLYLEYRGEFKQVEGRVATATSRM